MGKGKNRKKREKKFLKFAEKKNLSEDKMNIHFLRRRLAQGCLACSVAKFKHVNDYVNHVAAKRHKERIVEFPFKCCGSIFRTKDDYETHGKTVMHQNVYDGWMKNSKIGDEWPSASTELPEIPNEIVEYARSHPSEKALARAKRRAAQKVSSSTTPKSELKMEKTSDGDSNESDEEDETEENEVKRGIKVEEN
ncbi:hypothetical protein DdX_06665 [Ditylenchus destructor]|uniref:Uncharacterized protein n=1 Tax=Ditylenchus destructor TaxID=166010 RepID=A0AAD4N813_9BILA|nr:hypothetical protein DdX_06665 [Ditylenchus destructor]